MFLNTMIIGLLCIIVGTLFSQDAVNILAVIWSKLSCTVAPVKVTITGRGNYSPHNAYVVVANHQSMVDIPAVHGFMGLTIKWVMKKELGSVPIFGGACKSLGCIFVDRKNPGDAIHALQLGQSRMSKKASTLFFAEGTRSRDGRVMPFKKGAFIFARETGLPILPITIKGSNDVLPSDTMDLTPGPVEIIVHRPVYLTNSDDTRLDETIQKVRATISAPLED